METRMIEAIVEIERIEIIVIDVRLEIHGIDVGIEEPRLRWIESVVITVAVEVESEVVIGRRVAVEAKKRSGMAERRRKSPRIESEAKKEKMRRRVRIESVLDEARRIVRRRKSWRRRGRSLVCPSFSQAMSPSAHEPSGSVAFPTTPSTKTFRSPSKTLVARRRSTYSRPEAAPTW